MVQQDAAALIDDLVARGVFRAAPQPASRSGAAVWQITWFGGHVMRWEVAEGRIRVAPVLPDVSARSRIYRDLRVWLKTQQSPDLPPHRRLDPAQYDLVVSNRGGHVSLRLDAKKIEAAPLLNRAVQLVNALYHDFLNGPGRLDWVTEAFGLDPDHPRFS